MQEEPDIILCKVNMDFLPAATLTQGSHLHIVFNGLKTDIPQTPDELFDDTFKVDTASQSYVTNLLGSSTDKYAEVYDKVAEQSARYLNTVASCVKTTAIRALRSIFSLVLLLILMNSTVQAELQNKAVSLSSESVLVSNEYIETQLHEIDSLLHENDDSAPKLIVDNLLNKVISSHNAIVLNDVYFKLGKIHYKYKYFNEAIIYYEKSLLYIEGSDDESRKLFARTYHEIAQCFKHLKDVPKSIDYYKKGLEIHQSREDSLSTAIALKNISMAENKQSNYLIALDYAHRSLAIFSTEGSLSRYAEVLLTTGIIYRNIGLYEKSLDYIQQAKGIYEQINDVRHLAEVDNQIGLIYTSLRQLDNAKSFYTQTIELPIESVKPETRAAAFRELGVINFYQNNAIQSIDMLTTALAIYRSINSLSKTTRIDLLLGRSYLQQDKPEIATHYLKQSLALAIELGQVELQIQSLNYLGELKINKDVDQAISLFERALLLSSQVDVKDDQLMTYHGLKQSLEKKGDLSKALEYSEKKYQLMQAIQRDREDLDFTKNQVILASYKLEEELKGLREDAELNTLKLGKQRNELSIMKQLQHISELENKKNRFANLLLITVLSVFVLVSAYILYQYRKTRAVNLELDYLASRDPLTNCYNRRILYLNFNQVFDAEEKPKQYSVLLADIDSFKAINDTYGHATGDKVIQGIANILLKCAGEDDTVARFGGEEFCILLPKLNPPAALALAEQIRQEIESSRFESISATCSFGVASLKPEDDNDLTLIEQADIALYQSKYLGKNQVCVWDNETIGSKP